MMKMIEEQFLEDLELLQKKVKEKIIN